MECPHCRTSLLEFALPAPYRDQSLLPAQASTPTEDDADSPTAAAICPTCLTLVVEGDMPGAESPPPLEAPRTTTIGEAFPREESAAVPFALALGCCASLAMNRDTIATLLERVERAGTDPLLAIDRLLADPDVEPAIDLERRRHQLEQVLYG